MRLINIVLVIAFLVLSILMMIGHFQSRAKYAQLLAYNTANSLRFTDYDSLIYDQDFMANESQLMGDEGLGYGEIFAIDNEGNLTVDVNNLDRGDYLPYSSILDGDKGHAYYQGRIIAWAKVGDYTVIYRKYIQALIRDTWWQFIILWSLCFAIIYFNNRESKTDVSKTGFENGIRLRIFESFFYNYGLPRIVIDEEMVVFEVNKLFKREFNVSRDKIVGIRVNDYFKDVIDVNKIAKFIQNKEQDYLEMKFEYQGQERRLEISKTTPILGSIYTNATISK